MTIENTTAKVYLKKINNKLLPLSDHPTDPHSSLDQETINRYFESTRAVFQDFLHAMLVVKTDGERKALILDMCNVNALYSIQLKLGYELPPDLAEVAYDFDNPDYPGLTYLVDKITNHKYLIQNQPNKT